jgi:GTP cyclohydrolase FolE2
MPGRRLEDRIRELCAKAATASDADTVQVLRELREALHQHARHLRALAAEKLTGGMQGPKEERRTKK